jgi:hypothetical protein
MGNAMYVPLSSLVDTMSASERWGARWGVAREMGKINNRMIWFVCGNTKTKESTIKEWHDQLKRNHQLCVNFPLILS